MDAAARQFSEAYDAGQHPMEFVNAMRKKGELIMGVGHRVKSINNPDMRVTIIKVSFLFKGHELSGPQLTPNSDLFQNLP